MTRKLRMVGLALTAVFMFGAIGTAAAQAEAEFHSSIEKTFLFGEQEGENIFKTPAGNVKCKKATFDSITAQTGTKTAGPPVTYTTKMVTVHPEYKECTAFGQTATVATGSCDYTITGNGAGAGKVQIVGTTETHGVLTEPNSCKIVVTVTSGACGLEIANQTPTTNALTITTVGTTPKRGIKVTSGVSGIAYTKTGTGTICGSSGTASYEGSVVVKGYSAAGHEAGNQVDVWYE